MSEQLWALVDIETNGVSPKRDDITEIAIITIEEGRVIERWSTLVRPRHAIPEHITRLTGISNEMVRSAHSFEALAEHVYDKLYGKLFVAHNARFDYAFLKHAFASAGLNFSAKVLCTVKLSRALFSQYRHHNMDSLIQRFALSPGERHRAMTDADMLYQFIMRCRQEVGKECFAGHIQALTKCASLPPYLSTSIDDIPDGPGVYLFYGNHTDTPIYIGKSIHLKKRILSHFSSDHRASKALSMSQQVREIKWVETVGELGALLLESQLIKEKIPVYNQRLRRTKYVYGFHRRTINAYMNISIAQMKEASSGAHIDIIGCFKTKRLAEQHLRSIMENYHLCSKLCGFEHSQRACFHYQLKKCHGACIQKEPMEQYNARVEQALAHYKTVDWPFKGPIGIQERCTKTQKLDIHVVNYWRHIATVHSLEDAKKALDGVSSIRSTHDESKILQAYIKKVPTKDIIDFSSASHNAAHVALEPLP